MPGKAERTKERILNAARELFNRHGTADVDTHEIAKAARMSPGNLYYHYGGKREIVRALVERLALYNESAWRRKDATASPEALADFLLDAVARDRFFFDEFAVLLRKDKPLAEAWRARHRRLTAALAKFSGGGAEAEALADRLWLIGRSAAAYFELKGRLSASEAGDGARRLMLMGLSL